MKIEIDSESGFCYGVVRAVEKAESYLNAPSCKENPLYSIGSIVHNNAELERLQQLGLKVIASDDLSTLKNSTVLIRAHGEPPQTYQTAQENNLKVIDCTCPVVLKLQELIRSTHQSNKEHGGQIVIFGKHGHAEVNGLVGQTNGEAIVVEDIDDFDKALKAGLLTLNNDIFLFAQTTKNPADYLKLQQYITQRLEQGETSREHHFEHYTEHHSKLHPDRLHIFNTICGKVSSRHLRLKQFAKDHSIILFISGRESSNGKVLFEICRSANPRSYLIEGIGDIDPQWLQPDDNIGICGANSTPRWQLEGVKNYLMTFHEI